MDKGIYVYLLIALLCKLEPLNSDMITISTLETARNNSNIIQTLLIVILTKSEVKYNTISYDAFNRQDPEVVRKAQKHAIHSS